MIEEIKKVKRQLRDRLNKCVSPAAIRMEADSLEYRPKGWPYSAKLLPIPSRAVIFAREFVVQMAGFDYFHPSLGNGYFGNYLWMSDVGIDTDTLARLTEGSVPEAFTTIIWFPKEDTHV